MVTYATKGDIKILVTPENIHKLEGYRFIQEENKVEEIKQKYQDLIYSKYSITDQNNMNARITEINTLAKIENRDFTDLEIEDITIGQEMFNFIRDQRLACKTEIDDLAI